MNEYLKRVNHAFSRNDGDAAASIVCADTMAETLAKVKIPEGSQLEMITSNALVAPYDEMTMHLLQRTAGL